MTKSYVLLDLVSINVTTKKTNNDTIVFCDSITVEKREDQLFESIDDWSNIIIGNSKYNVDGEQTVNVSTIDTNSGAVTLEENIGLWSVILFKTITDKDGAYTKLNDVISGSSGVGGSGTGETGVEEVYFDNNITEYAKNTDLVNDFLKDVLGNTFNGCIFIDNSNCGIFLNISALMFNEQTNLEKISLTNTIVYIGETSSVAGVFSNCNNLVNANIPEYLGCYNIIETKQDGTTSTKNNTTRTVPGYYFHNCKLLESIIIPNGITQIGFSSFYGCDSVKTINIPSSVLTVYSNSLLTVNREETRYINVNGDVDDKTDITFFSKSVGYNKPSDNNTPYCQNTVIISINNRGIVNLYGSISLNDTSFITNVKNDSKIYIDCEKINGVSIGNTTNSSTKFYYGGFIGTTFETIYIGPTVENICDFVFYNVTGTNLIIDNNHILNKDYTDNTETGSLESNEYQDGTYLIKTPFAKSKFNNIDILNCETIGKYALHSLNSNNLTFYKEGYTTRLKDDLEITNNILLTTLSDYTFYNSSFGEITIPSSVNSISNTSFLQTKGSLILNCNISTYETIVNQNEHKHTGILVNSEFSKITFDYVGSIPANVLYENKYINSIELGDNISQIYAKAFYLCTNLSNTLTIPSELSDISTDAFIGCIFSKFEVSESPTPTKYQTDDSGMYLLTDNKTSIVLFANKHTGIQIVDNTFNINIDGVTGIGNYAFAYAFSDYVNSNVYAVTISKNIKRFGGNVFYNCHKLTRITFYPDNIAEFEDLSTSPNNIEVNGVSLTGVSIYGSFSDLPLLKDVYIGYATGVLLSDSIPNNDEERNNFLYNTIRNSYTNNDSDISKITIYVYEELVKTYEGSAWKLAGYKISGISKGVPPQPPVPPVENDDSYDADIDDPEGEEWPWDGGNGNISDEEDYIPPVDVSNTTTEENNDNWIKPNENNNGFIVPIKQLGIPSINIYGCILDLLNPTYHDDKVPVNSVVIDDSGKINQEALDNLIFNKVSNETKNGWSSGDNLFKLYLGDAGNNFLVIFTATGIDNFDATTKIFTSGVEYPINKESNWLNTTIVRIVEARHHNSEIETLDVEGETSNDISEKIYYVVLLCTCLKLQTKDNYNCRTAIVSVNYGSQMLDSSTNTDEQITTKIKILQHKTELRLSNNTREINITDLPVLFCQQTERTEFTGNFFIGFPKNFWSIGTTIDTDGTSTNKNKLREYINDYFRILYDKEKIKVIGQKTKIGELDYTYIFDVADDKYANIKEPGSTTSILKKFSLCSDKEKNSVHEEYYYVNFKIENLKTSLAGGVWNISIYNIGEPAEMLNIQAIEDKTDIPSISVMFEGTFDVENYEGIDAYDKYIFTKDELITNACYSIDELTSVRMQLALPTVVTGIPTYYEGNKLKKIYPSEELIDLCVDKSVVNMCGLSLLGNNMSGNVYNAFTTTINGTSLNLGVSSNSILSNSLNTIKFTSTNSIKQSLYNYKTVDTTINRYDILQNCSRQKSLIKTQRIGDGANEILENTETYIYLIDTGYSALTNVNTNDSLYENYLFTKQEIQSAETNLHGETKLDSGSVKDKLKETIQHNESSETGVYIEANNVLTDTYYNVLAPLYEYVYENTYNGVTSIDINPNVKLNDITHVYYCTSYRTDCVVNKDDKLYILKDKSNSETSIEIWDNDDKRYKCGHLEYKLYGNNININIYPLYEYKINRVDDNNNFEITVNSSGVNKVDSNYFDVVIGENSIKSQRVIKIGLDVTYNGNINISNKTVYKDNDDNYRDTSSGKLITNIIADAINENTINIIEIQKHCYFIYIDNNPEIIDGYIYAHNGGGSQMLDENKIKIVNDHPTTGNDQYIIYDEYISGWYQIYNASGVHVTYDAMPDENGNLNNGAVEFYKTRDIATIKSTLFTPPTEQLTGNKINIIPKELSSINPTLFRQIFYHLYYEINDNGKKIKVYDDNNSNAIMHLRLMNSYNYPTTIKFSISNVFGIKIDNGYTLNSDNTAWQQPNITIIKPGLVP